MTNIKLFQTCYEILLLLIAADSNQTPMYLSCKLNFIPPLRIKNQSTTTKPWNDDALFHAVIMLWCHGRYTVVILCCQWPATGSCFVSWFYGTQMCVCVYMSKMRDEWVTSCPKWKNLAHSRDRVWLVVCSELGQLVNDCSMCVQADCSGQHTTQTQSKGHRARAGRQRMCPELHCCKWFPCQEHLSNSPHFLSTSFFSDALLLYYFLYCVFSFLLFQHLASVSHNLLQQSDLDSLKADGCPVCPWCRQLTSSFPAALAGYRRAAVCGRRTTWRLGLWSCCSWSHGDGATFWFAAGHCRPQEIPQSGVPGGNCHPQSSQSSERRW